MSPSSVVFESHTTNTLNEMLIPAKEKEILIEITTHVPTTITTPPPQFIISDIRPSATPISKQLIPLEPAKEAPKFLIIQGHSKVKTYGPDNSSNSPKHHPKMVPVVPMKDPVVTHVVSQDDLGNELKVSHVHSLTTTTARPTKRKSSRVNENHHNHKKTKAPEKKSTMESLLSILDTSFGGFFANDGNEANAQKPTHVDKKLKQNIIDSGIDRETVNFVTTERVSTTTAKSATTRSSKTVSFENT